MVANKSPDNNKISDCDRVLLLSGVWGNVTDQEVPETMEVRPAEGTVDHGLATNYGIQNLRTKIEKEKKEHAKQHGMIRTEISGAEIAEEMEKERRFFQLQMCEANDRTYHFQAEDEPECQIWMSVLQNSKEEALNNAFKGGDQDVGENNIVQELTKAILAELAKNIGNAGFNEVMEACLASEEVIKPSPTSDMNARKDYITAKYIERKFSRKKCVDNAAKLHSLCEAVKAKDIFSLVQVYAEGVDMTDPIPLANGHVSTKLFEKSLPKIRHLRLNLRDGNLDKQTAKGSTALHYCCLTDNIECLKLLLRGKASIEIANEAGETALDIAKRLKHTQCEELLAQALSGKFNAHVHVEYEWRLHHEDLDESDDDVDEKSSPHRREERPVSCFQPGTSQLQPTAAALASDAANLVKDKQRGYIPSLVNNETYGAILSASPPPNQTTVPVTTNAPPLPPRNIGKADNPDELTFSEGEVIIVDGEEDHEWWVSDEWGFQIEKKIPCGERDFHEWGFTVERDSLWRERL
ncbi:UNVERIFIED_CONTAM: hypothetical protein FKN15_000883 [Acipenser sinensis]